MSLEVMYNTIKNKYEKYNHLNKVCEYKKKYTLEERKQKSKDILNKYPDRIPIICYTSPELPELKNCKFLVNEDLSYTNFMFNIRKNIKLTEGQSIYIFIGNKLLSSSLLFKEIYSKYKEEDGFLYAYICSENTFG